MIFIIGGSKQGKFCYAREHFGAKEEEFADGGDCGLLSDYGKKDEIRGVKHLHLYIKRRLLEGGNPSEEIKAFLAVKPDCILITNEIGYGIVPVDDFERSYRETTGRICCNLAQEAAEVVRVTCGIGRKIKG